MALFDYSTYSPEQAAQLKNVPGQSLASTNTPQQIAAAQNINQGSLTGTMTSQPSTQISTQTQVPGASPVGLDDTSFLGVLNNLQGGLKQNNALVDQKNLIQKQMFDAPLTPEELAKLPPDVRSIVQGGNRDQMALQLQIINDSLQGRNNSIASSIQFLTTGYEQAQTRYNQDVTNVLNYAKALNAKPSDVMKALYPSEAARLGTQLDALAAPLLTSTQIPGTSGSFDVSIPEGTIASQTNNPLNIKYSPTSVAGGDDSGIAAKDGGTFASFGSPTDGLGAGIKLLKSSLYSSLTVDQAMRQWSNNGYGSEVSPSLNANQKISSLSDYQLNQLVSDMATRESNATVTPVQSDVQVTAQGIVDGTIPPPVNARGTINPTPANLRLEAAVTRQGGNLTKLATDWSALQKWLTSANSTTQLRLRQAIGSVKQGIEGLRSAANDWNAGGFAPLNAVNLKAALNGVYGQKAQQIAAVFDQQRTIIQDELGQTFMGGNSPTDQALKLSGQTLNENWSKETLSAALDNLDKNLGYRLNSIETTGPIGVGGTGTNTYSPIGGTSGSSYDDYLKAVK